MTERDREYIDNRIESYLKGLNDVLLIELQELKNDIKEVKENVKRINGTVREVCEWRAGHQSHHATRESSHANTIKLLGVIIAFFAMTSGMYFGFRNTNRKVENLRYNYEVQDRYLQWKFGETPVNPTTRGKPLDFPTVKDTL